MIVDLKTFEAYTIGSMLLIAIIRAKAVKPWMMLIVVRLLIPSDTDICENPVTTQK